MPRITICCRKEGASLHTHAQHTHHQAHGLALSFRHKSCCCCYSSPRTGISLQRLLSYFTLLCTNTLLSRPFLCCNVLSTHSLYRMVSQNGPGIRIDYIKRVPTTHTDDAHTHIRPLPPTLLFTYNEHHR